MKKTLIALAAMAATGFGMSAMAEEVAGPVMLTDTQMENVVAGVGDELTVSVSTGSGSPGAAVLGDGQCVGRFDGFIPGDTRNGPGEAVFTVDALTC